MRAVRLPRLRCALLGLLPLAARAGASEVGRVTGAVERAWAKKAPVSPSTEEKVDNFKFGGG